MPTKSQEYKQISAFLAQFSIQQHTPGSTVISSPSHTYLIRDTEISPSSQGQNSQQLTQIINALYQHQTLSSKNILSLIDFDIIFNPTKTQTQIRAIYQYGKKSLSKELEQRKPVEEHFDEEALWGLMYSITSPLAYLEEKNIIYGVLDPSRVYLDNNNIALIDPSSTGIDPYQIAPNRLYSPQLLQEFRSIEDLDMFKSDVYVLGLMMLQCALLKTDLYQYDEEVIRICLTEIKELYSENLCQLIESLLDPNPEARPSFTEVLSSISDLFEISSSEMTTLQPSVPDCENEPNPKCEIDEESQKQVIDVLETEYVRPDQRQSFGNPHHRYSHNHRFPGNINRSPESLAESMIEEASEYSETSSLCLQDSVEKSFEKSRRMYKPKQIKDRLITQDYALNSERNRSKNSGEQQNSQSQRGNMTSERNPINSSEGHNNKSTQRSGKNSQKESSRLKASQNGQVYHTHTRSKTSYDPRAYVALYEQKKNQKIMKPSKHNESSQRHNESSHRQSNSSHRQSNSSCRQNESYGHSDSSSFRVYEEESKQNQFSKNNGVHFSPLNKDNLFTKPQIMKMIKSDMKRIQEKKKTGLSVHFNYFNHENTENGRKTTDVKRQN